MRWLITGGCGFIGRNLIRILSGEPGTAIRVVDDLTVGTEADLAAALPLDVQRSDRRREFNWMSGVVLIRGDVRDEGLAVQAADGADIIVHLAANTGVALSVAEPRRDCSINIIGTVNYLEAARHRNVRRFVFASSGAPVGECQPPLHEELPAHPVSPYGASKLAGEAYCSAYKRSFGIDTVSLRFGNCYGPYSGHKSSIVAKFIREALSGEPWNIYGDGRQTRDFIFVEDIVDAIRRGATTAHIGGETFQIATNTETTIIELAARLQTILSRHGVAQVETRFEQPRIGDVLRNYSNVRKARERLGWRAAVDLDDGLDRTVKWFIERAPQRHD